MSAFQRTQRRYLCNGVQLTRTKDSVDPGKWPILENVRSVLDGTIQARQGLEAIPGATFEHPIHTIVRFDDATPYAGTSQLYFVGESTVMQSGPINGPFAAVDSGYSGRPLSWATATPPSSPQPWLYVADPARMRKFDANGHVYNIGIQPPFDEPAAELQALGLNVIEQFGGLFIPWVPVNGSVVSGLVQRVNTTIASVVFDNGTGGNTYASVAATVMDGINEGMLLTVGGSETIAVTETTIAVATTTIAAIQYDSGGSGLCTIQPAASLGTGQLEGPTRQDYQTRYGIPYAVPRGTQVGGTGTGLPPAPDAATPTGRIRQVDFPVSSLVTLGSELVRIESIAVGPDGVQSFRCRTASTHSTGEAIVGVAGFRAYLVGAWTAGATLTDDALEATITIAAPVAPATTSQATGGVRTGAGWAQRNLALINQRATLPDDDIYLAMRADDFVAVKTVRVYFSLEPTAGTAPSGTDFTENYFFFEWRQSDIATAIQATNGSTVSPMTTARQVAQANAITDLPTAGAVRRNPSTTTTGSSTPTIPQGTPSQASHRNPNAATVRDAVSQQLALGNNQWIALHCKVKDLIHIGTEASKTLANVTAAEVLVDTQSTVAQTVTVGFDGLWLAGGYEPDTGAVGTPYSWCYRYRSSATGGRSNPSPALRGGVIPRRQHVLLTGQASGDPQVDLVDWFRLGGTLTNWTYVGTVPNGATFDDTYGDAAVDGGEGIDYNLMPPFPTEDIQHSGTCDIAGSSITWRSGDTFNTNWMPGSLIVVNGQAYTLYSQPTSSTRLFINENAGSGSNVAFTVPNPTIINQNFGSVWGGPVQGAQFLFGCRNPINPGAVSWTNGNDVETASDKNSLQVTDASEPLQAGFMWDGVSFVASTENLYALQPTFGGVSTFTPTITPCGRGFWTPFAWCMAPEGIYFLAKDGIFLTSGGSGAVSITDADLYPIFPHEGVPAQPVNGYQPVYMGPNVAAVGGDGCAYVGCGPDAPNLDQRLAYIDGWVVFDYADMTGARHTLNYHVATKAWYPDTFTPGINMRVAGVGEQVHEALLGGVDGTLYRTGSAADNGVGFAAHAQYVDNQGDARRYKAYRDLFLRGDLSGAVAQVAVSFNDEAVPLPAQTLAGLTGVQNYVIDTVPQTGVFAFNMTVDLQWSPASTFLPRWDVADVAFQPLPEGASSWLSGPTTLGSNGYKQIPRALLCYISTTDVTLSVIVDGVTYTYTLPNTNGQFLKNQVVLQSVKGLAFQLGVQAPVPFLLFDQELEVWCQPWGQAGGYRILKPF